MSNKKLLVSGCGLTFGNENIKSWPKILRSVGVNVVDLSGPAVSNQWILDRAFEYLFKFNDIDSVAIQLTNIDKLDVQLTPERHKELIQTDSLRNFVWQDIWPSSVSAEHVSKNLYYQYLYSPALITKELAVKCKLLNFWCAKHDIKLQIYQGYDIPWTSGDLEMIGSIIENVDRSWYQDYTQGNFYKFHDFARSNTVPCVEYFFSIAEKIAKDLELPVLDKLSFLNHSYKNKHKPIT